MKASNPKDLRPGPRYLRVPVSVSARISTIDPEIEPGSGERYYRASSETCMNVSDGGAFVATDDTLPPGRRVHLEILLPGDPKPIEAVGRVAWSRARLTSNGISTDSGMGIEFLGGPPEDLARIARFVDDHPSRSVQASGNSGPKPTTPAHSEPSPRRATPPPLRGA